MKNKPLIFTFLSILIALLITETLAFVFFKTYGSKRLAYHLKVDDQRFKDELLKSEPLQSKGANFDTYLGWDEPKVITGLAGPYEFASRPIPKIYPTTIAIAYGDSFTYGQDVKDDQTWQSVLAEKLHANVVNYGVRGFGTDQALAKLERNLNRGIKSKIIILAMLSENIARVVNISPQHYWATDNISYFKPIFESVNNKLIWREDLLIGLKTKTGRATLLQQIEKLDFWYEYNKSRPSNKFPYILSAVTVAKYILFDLKRCGQLYGNKQATFLLKEIVDKFYSLSVSHEFLPVFVMIPDPQDLKLRQNGQRASYYSFLSEITKFYAGKTLLIIDSGVGINDFEKFNLQPFLGHASAYGNEVIAGKVYDQIISKWPDAININ